MPESFDTLNNPIGAVTYTPVNATDNIARNPNGTLLAHWAFSAQEGIDVVCKGIAVPYVTEKHDAGDDAPENDPFIGDYKITYAGPDGQESDPWDLVITREGEIYHAIWSKNDVAHYHGIGFISQENLICGWRPVT
ncbi:hypothetical protein WH96_05565 [Kiloniella spongiae]|uniref:Uncharacterized protein n=1 Tax=Kiloniella spongiae TaxID=1489064 RepID=A0A0H2MGP5_9PROT|nr:hypothetical protein [Kiloniella spongiae]KLN61764.1 hypothetical protein WH96_05565 [Kiloniella spongiae]